LDAFLAKVVPAGNALVYSTYLGGDNSDFTYSIELDSSGAVYLAGLTNSANFPRKNPYDNTFNGELDAFVTKLK
jgi:hypothetical protein